MTITTVPVYPYNYYSFAEAYNFSDDQVNTWVVQCIEDLEEHPEATYSRIKCGNTYVMVSRGSAEEGIKYEIFVSKSHSEALIFEEERC